MAQLRYKPGTASSTEVRAKIPREAIPDADATGDDHLLARAGHMRLGFLTGQYPRATDTFIQREVAVLRSLGYHVQTFSIRKPPVTENVSAENTMFARRDWPDTNMWWPQTMNDSSASDTDEYAMNR